MKSILAFILLIGSIGWAKPSIESFVVLPKKQYELQSKLKNPKVTFNFKVEIILKNKKDILEIQKKAQSLGLHAEFYPDYFKKNIFQAQVIGEKQAFDKFINYLKPKEVKKKKETKFTDSSKKDNG